MTLRRLKYKEIKEYRDEVLKRYPEYRCPICDQVVVDPVLDHCHVTGFIRDVVCRECNALEGKVHNFMSRFMPKKDKEKVLLGLVQYILRDYSQNPLHPTFKTEDEKEIQRLQKRKKKAKKDCTKKRLQDQINEIKRRTNVVRTATKEPDS